MSWLFSRALVEEYLADNCSDGTQSAQLSGSPIPQAYLPKDRMTAFSRPSRFGMTFEPLTDERGEDLLMWFREDFLVRTYPRRDEGQESKASDPACGRKWRGSLARYDHDMRSWKTAQHSLLGGSGEYAETWPRWGTTVGGELYLLPMPALPMKESASGLWPTPTAHNSKEGAYPAEFSRNTPTLTSKAAGGVPTQPITLNPEWVEWLNGWPRTWTDLKPLETAKSHKPQPSHGEH